MSELVIEDGGLSEADIALAKELHAESAKEPETTETTDVQEESVESVEEQSDNAENENKSSEDSSSVEEHYKFQVKGEEKEFTKKDLINILSREETFQKKYNKLTASEELKLGSLVAAAKEGDKGARKQLFDQLKEMEADLESLEEIEEEFDVEEVISKKQQSEEMEEIFSDVKSDVDYEENLSKIESDLKSKLPEKVYNEYWNGPETRRVMYDLVKSGKTEEVFGALNEELSKLPLVERVKIKRDPEAYGDMVVEVINDLYAQPQSQKQKDQEPSDLDSVSTGNSSHSNPTKDDSQIDWDKLSPEEFAQREKALLGKNF